MLLVGQQEGHLVCKKYCHISSVPGSSCQHAVSKSGALLLSQEGCFLEAEGQCRPHNHHIAMGQIIKCINHFKQVKPKLLVEIDVW